MATQPVTTMQPLDPLTLPLDGVRLIEASAGTGKTYTIATLYLRLLLERGLSVRQVLVVTFTKAATEELRDRIRARLREALAVLRGAATDDAQLKAIVARVEDRAAAARRLTVELTCIDEAAVFTIHGFCQRMLQENAFESGALFDAEFVTDESELLAQVVRDFWRRSFYRRGPGLAALARDTWGDPQGLSDAIRSWLGKGELQLLPAIDAAQLDAEFQHRARALCADWPAARAGVLELLATHDGLSRAQTACHPERVKAVAEAIDAWCEGEIAGFTAPPGLELFTPAVLDGHITDAKRRKGVTAPAHPFFDTCAALLALRSAKQVALTAEAIAWCRTELTRRKRERAIMAFDDLLAELRAALEGAGGARLADRIADNFPVALIDEFQDTDLSQFRIFRGIYADRDRCALLLIGDPKQAIYSFRGADIFTYMEAKRGTPAAARYTLDTNWRSSTPLVHAVNTLFDAAHAPFLFAGHIDFQPVNAAGRADAAPLVIEGEGSAPLIAWLLSREGERPLTKGGARTRVAEACAAEVARLLRLGAAGLAHIGGEPLRERDIAVLVRDRNEARAAQEALRAVGVRSVYYSRDSVFGSEEAQALARLLEAVAKPGDEALLRAALCDSLIGVTAAELDALLRDEAAWEERIHGFADALERWRQHGFMAMFRRMLHAERVPARLLARGDGERRLTDLLQVAELLQGASGEHPAPEQLLRWFAEQRSAPNGEREDEQLRLESDEALVKIVTVHRSKGLEYPVVFLPFLWGCRPHGDGPVLFHEEETAGGAILHLDPDDRHHAGAERERLAEDVRLAYVALTRARHRCYFAWGAVKEAERSALAWLLFADAQTHDVDALARKVGALTDEDHTARLAELSRRCDGALVVAAPPEAGTPIVAAAAATGASAARVMGRAVPWDWRITSYTALTANRFEPGERPDYGDTHEDAEGELEGAQPRFRFPKGARAGVFLHELLQKLDFALAGTEQVATEVKHQLRRHGFDPLWRDGIAEWLGELLETPLAAGLTLRSLTRARRSDELEFHYPIAPMNPRALEPLLAECGIAGAAELAGPRLDFQPAAGMMRGFIDLVFEHEGRFFIADYKSSWLGARFDAYRPDALAHTVAAHRYDLQYLIYSLALHRHLGLRVPGYDHERHFGGVWYLFLRGMSPRHAGCGVYFDRPARSVIERFDRLVRGGT